MLVFGSYWFVSEEHLGRASRLGPVFGKRAREVRPDEAIASERPDEREQARARGSWVGEPYCTAPKSSGSWLWGCAVCWGG